MALKPESDRTEFYYTTTSKVFFFFLSLKERDRERAYSVLMLHYVFKNNV